MIAAVMRLLFVVALLVASLAFFSNLDKLSGYRGKLNVKAMKEVVNKSQEDVGISNDFVSAEFKPAMPVQSDKPFSLCEYYFDLPCCRR